MDKRYQSIAIFDSGVGGLSVMQEVIKLLPYENIVYFADSLHLPYGNKSAGFITERFINSLSYLSKQPVKLIIIACHTACALALDHINMKGLPFIIDLLDVSVQKMLEAKNKELTILATQATVDSQVYLKKLQKKMPTALLQLIPCPSFVSIIEDGFFNTPIARQKIQETLKFCKLRQTSSLFLACTHYLFLEDMIKKELGEEIPILDPGKSCALATQQYLQQQKLLNPKDTLGKYQYHMTGNKTRFLTTAKRVFAPITSKECIQVV